MVKLLQKLYHRLLTSGRLLLYFLAPGRWFLAPLLLVLLCAGLLLAATTGLSYVAPFVYTLF